MAKTDLSKIKNPPPPAPDEGAKGERDELERDAMALRNEAFAQDLEFRRQSGAQDLRLRREFAWDIFYLIIGWLALVCLILLFNGFALTIYSHVFKLSDSVLLGLIGGTTASVIGIFIVVVRNLFPQRSASP